MFDYGLDLVELGWVDIARHTHDECVVGHIQPSLVSEQGRGVFRGRVAGRMFWILVFVHREELLWHRGVFRKYPLALVVVGIPDLEAFCYAESVIEGGTKIADLTVMAETVDMVATLLQETVI